MGSVGGTKTPPRFLVIGAGSRGHAYARAVKVSTSGVVAAVAEIDDFKRQEFGLQYIWNGNKPQPHQAFSHWQDWVDYETQRRIDPNDSTTSPSITGVFICTLDDTHAPIIQALAPFNLHILCEKPLALSLKDCLSISTSLKQYPSRIVSIGHVLRYSPHNILLRKLLLEDCAIGEIVSIEHTEPIGWWHFSHSYVRGNWRRSHEAGVGSLLTKSCHDIDLLMWLLCSPSRLAGDAPHQPSSITSTGSLTHFRRSRKPKKAATATNCLTCAAEPECQYSAKKLYRDRSLRLKRDTGWPLKIVVPEIEDIVARSGWAAGEDRLMEVLSEDYDSSRTLDAEVAARAWYGRCVYESDNDVCDEQTVTMSWDEDPRSGGDEEFPEHGRGSKTALFHMTYPTLAQCDRRGRVYGSLGEIAYDSKTISIHTFLDGKTELHHIPKQAEEVEKSHGGGDWGLAGAFVNAVEAVESGNMGVEEAQRTFVGCDLEEIVRSHAVVFAAEEARLGKKVVDWPSWWSSKRSLLERQT